MKSWLLFPSIALIMQFGNGMILVFQLHFHYFKLQLKKVKSEMNQCFTTTEHKILLGTQAFML
jgi:hypothetical protein